jgi:hypothetical protein
MITDLERPPTAPPPFFHRVFMLPFSAQLWRESMHLTRGQVLLPLVVLALILNTALLAFRGVEAIGKLKQWTATYDDRFDPVVYEAGKVRVDGARLPRWDEAGSIFLVDPEETIAIDSLSAPNVTVVRKDQILRKSNDQPLSVTSMEQVSALIGSDRITVNSATLGAFTERYAAFTVGGFVFLGVFSGIFAIFACVFYAWIAAHILAVVKKKLGYTAREYLNVTLAISGIKLVVDVALSIAGQPMPFIVAIVVWPVLFASVAGARGAA